METLVSNLKDIDKKIDALLAHDELTAEQKAELESLETQRKKTTAAIGREKAKLARANEVAELEADIAATKAAEEAAAKRAGRQVAPGTGRVTDPDQPNPNDVAAERAAAEAEKKRKAGERMVIPATVRRFTPRSFKGTRNGFTAEERAYRFGMFCLAKLSMDIPGHFRFKHALDFYESQLAPQAAAVTTTDMASGYHYTIPAEFGTDLIDLREQYGVARRLCKIVPMASDTRTDPRRKSGLTAYFVTEAAAGTESNKAFDNVQLVARDLMVISRYTNQVNADSVISLGDDLAREIAYAFSNKEDDCWANGDGTSTYGGIQGIRTLILSGTNAGRYVAAATGAWSSLVLADFNNTIAKLPQYADDGNVAWVCHRAFYFAVMQRLELAAGGNTIMEISTGDRKARHLFLGYPVEFSQIFPAVTAATGIPVTLGNYAMGASFGDRQQDAISFSEHATVGGESLWERNQVGIRGTERFDINIHDYGTATNAGPIVALALA